MCEGTNQGLTYIQPEKKYCLEYESSKCPRNCEIRQELSKIDNVVMISEKERVNLRDNVIVDFDNKCKKIK